MQIDVDEAMRLLGMQVYLNSQLQRQNAALLAQLARATDPPSGNAEGGAAEPADAGERVAGRG